MPPTRDRPRPATMAAATVDLVDRPAPGSWLAACADLRALVAHHQLLDAVIQEVDGRRIRVDGRWLVDFASCNYLGLDLDPEVIAAIPDYLARWAPTRAGRGCWAAPPSTSRSRSTSPGCSGSRTPCCCRH